MGPHVTERLSAYMDGELGAPEREAVAAHLRSCARCARHLEDLRAVDTAARDLPLAVPDGYFEAFRGSLRQRLERPRPVRRRVAPVWTLAAAAVVVLALLTPRMLVRDSRARVPQRAAPAPTLAAHGPQAAAPPEAAAKTAPAVADTASRAPRAEAPAPAGSARDRLAEGARMPAAPPAAAAQEPAREQAENAAVAPKAGYAAPPPPAQTDEVQGALSGTAAPASKKEAESGAAVRDEEAKARRDKKAVGALQERAAPADAGADRFQLLAGRTVSSAAEARALRDAWRALARDEGAGPRADEARVRAVEAGIEAWRRSRDAKDRAEALKDGRAYLERADALQPDRVRDALRPLAR
jgi:hypothetical protein